jgi:hypothetical protein
MSADQDFTPAYFEVGDPDFTLPATEPTEAPARLPLAHEAVRAPQRVTEPEGTTATEEELVLDRRAHFRPAHFVEIKLWRLLMPTSTPVVRRGPASSNGKERADGQPLVRAGQAIGS